ncbi:MAG: ion transporter [Vulcanimicrobiota bacterium]
MKVQKSKEQSKDWRYSLHEVIYESDTFAGKAFDVSLIIAIILSIVVIILDSVASINTRHSVLLRTAEWIFTLLFTVEYILRIVCVRRPFSYIFSFFGIIDMLSVLPTYLSLLIPGAQVFLVVRSLRLLRLFRIFKMIRFISEADTLGIALRSSIPKITVFLLTVATIVIIVASLMHVVEGPERGFTNIPVSMYWTIVTLTTVGFGDITPQTTLGRIIASLLMILGYGIIAVPTGIVSVELAMASKKTISAQACRTCSREGHDSDALHCKYCGALLNE